MLNKQKEFFDQVELIKLNVSIKKAKTIDIIVKVLQEHKKSRSRDYSIATLGALIYSNGGPSTQSIRNKGGKDYRDVIDLFKLKFVTVKGLSDPIPYDGIDNHDTFLRRIDDPSIRAVVGMALREAKEVKKELKLLKRTPYNISVSSIGKGYNINPAGSPLLTEGELEALNQAISPKLIRESGWVIDENTGRVKDEIGNTIYKAGYITAIRKILGIE
jgi:hypothetical protein